MKYLKSFNESIDSDIREFANRVGVHLQDYEITPSGVIDVYDNFFIDPKKDYQFQKLPFKFGDVAGFFHCNGQNLTTLDNFPRTVGGSFEIKRNFLKSLEGGPTKVNGDYNCTDNPLTSLVGAPETCCDFSCGNDFFNVATNKKGTEIFIENLIGGPKSCFVFQISSAPYLTSLEGCPTEFESFLIMDCPKLTDPANIDLITPTEDGVTRKIKFYAHKLEVFISPFDPHRDVGAKWINEPLFHLMKLFPNEIEFDDFLKTFPCIRGNEINKEIFRMACEDFKIEMPQNIKGYKFV